MKRFTTTILFTSTLLMVNLAITWAYELATHGQITQRAFERSSGVRKYLEAVSIRENAVFNPSAVTPFSQLGEFFRNTGTLKHWMMEGAVREDDFKTAFKTCPQPKNPIDETTVDRVRNHFFDVQRGGGGMTASVGGVSINGIPAPDWALGLEGRTDNQYTILDARQYQLKSLTESSKANREESTALLFRALGQVVHVVQDMAQPQHTRNDVHSGCLGGIVLGQHSWYEDYIDMRARNKPFRAQGEDAPPLSLDNYSPPTFTEYRNYWTTSDRRGLADFSSRNFFSERTNLPSGCSGFSDPVCNASFYTPRDAFFSIKLVTGLIKSGFVTLILRDVEDKLTGEIIKDVAVSTRSVWTRHLEIRDFVEHYSMNTLNYDSISKVLLPRAVGYSEGLLDYFFRGRLRGVLQQVEGPSAAINDPPYTVQLSLTNESSEKMQGNFRLYIDRPDGTRTQIAGTPLDPMGKWTNQTIEAGATKMFSFSMSSGFGIVDQFFVVFQGTLGMEEGAVAGSVVDPAEFVEEWDNGLTGNHPWAHSTEIPDPNLQSKFGWLNRDNGVSTSQVVDGRLIRDNNRNAGDGFPRFSVSLIGPVYFGGGLNENFRDVFPIPITTQTEVELKIDDISINQQPPCDPGFTCAFQFLQFHFSGGRFLQFTIPGQSVSPGGIGATFFVNPGVPITFNIYGLLSLAGLTENDLQNLLLTNITVEQDVFIYFDPETGAHFGPDPLPRMQHMEVDYIRVINPVRGAISSGLASAP